MSPELKAPIITVTFYQRRWFKRAMIVIVLLLAAAVFVAILLFLSWWNSPEKALLDAGDYMTMTPGSYHIKSQTTDVTVTIRDNEYEAKGTFQGTTIDAIFLDGSLFLKSPDPSELYEFFTGVTDDSKIPTVVQAIIPTVRDKWISVNLNSVTFQSTDALSMQCIFQEKESISHDPNARRDWGASYLANRFMDIKTTRQSGQSIYQVTIDSAARTKFFNALLKTSMYQSLTSCSKDTDILRGIPSNMPLADVTLSQPQHILQSFVVNPGAIDQTTVTANYSSVPTITEPSGAISTDQLVVRYLQSIGSGQ